MRFFVFVIMEIIRSTDNKFVKKLDKLKRKKYRDEYGEFFVEGCKNVLDSIAARPDSLVTLVLCERSVALRDRFEKFGRDAVVLSDALFDKLCETENSQGVISVHKIPESVFPSKNVVLLDRVRDPGNVGTILRTALAAGYDVVADGCADIYSPKVVRSAMSAVLKCNIGVNIDVGTLKSRGYTVFCADMRGKNVFECEKPRGKYCIVIGNEADGISPEIMSECDAVLSLPQSGDIESLNAAVAAGVMMYVLNN